MTKFDRCNCTFCLKHRAVWSHMPMVHFLQFWTFYCIFFYFFLFFHFILLFFFFFLHDFFHTILGWNGKPYRPWSGIQVHSDLISAWFAYTCTILSEKKGVQNVRQLLIQLQTRVYTQSTCTVIFLISIPKHIILFILLLLVTYIVAIPMSNQPQHVVWQRILCYQCSS